MICSGCPTTKHLDLQLILDSSETIGDNPWLDLMDFLKAEFVDTVFISPDSKLAITRYGGDPDNNGDSVDVEVLQ